MWMRFDCQHSFKRWQELPQGLIEIEGEGAQKSAWPKDVDRWERIIAAKSSKYDIPASWIAAIMAIESGGRTDVCYRIGGSCSTADGAGLMAVMASTAKGLIGRKVYPDEMMANPDLAVELGTMLMDKLRDRVGHDYVKIAMSYNAGSIRCSSSGSSGSTVTDGHGPKESCPATPWGVIMGCIRSSKSFSPHCSPSTVVSGMYACPVDYPDKAIRALNAAVDHGWNRYGLGRARAATALGGLLGSLIPFGIGAGIGYLGTRLLLPSIEGR